MAVAIRAPWENRMKPMVVSPATLPAKQMGFFKSLRYGSQQQVLATYREKAAMNEVSGLQGGYIVPKDYSTLLLRSLAEHSFLRPRATVVPMGSLETQCPMWDATTNQGAGVSPFFGGMTFAWGVQSTTGTSYTEKEPTTRLLTLKACDLIGMAYASNQFVMDLTPEGEHALAELFGEAAAWQEEYAFFNGTGGDNLQPLGILNAPALITATRAGANHIVKADVSKMIKSLIPSSWGRAIWAVSPTVLEDLVQITDYFPNEDPLGIEMGCCGNLFTRPVFVTEKLPPLGSKGDLLLFDPSLYVIGDRQETEVAASEVPLFGTNQTVFRVIRRVDGRPLLNGTVTLADGSTVASAYVALAA